MQTAQIIGPQCSSAIGTVPTAVGGYTPPSSVTYAVVTELTVANKLTVLINVSVSLYNGSTDFFLAYGTNIAQGDSFYFPRPITLTNGWYIRVSSSNVSSVDATMSVTQFT